MSCRARPRQAREERKMKTAREFADEVITAMGSARNGVELERDCNRLTKMIEAWEKELKALGPLPSDVEALSAKFHEIYQQEAKRQGDVRHKDAYADLPENIKEFDRVLAIFVLAETAKLQAEIAELKKEANYHRSAFSTAQDNYLKAVARVAELRADVLAHTRAWRRDVKIAGINRKVFKDYMPE